MVDGTNFVSFDRLAAEYSIWSRPQGLMGVWGGIIRQWLEELLPHNAAELCRCRVSVSVTYLRLSFSPFEVLTRHHTCGTVRFGFLKRKIQW